MTDLSVRLQALRDDALQWGRASRALNLASENAGNADLGIPQFGQIAENVGLVSMYTSLQDLITKALAGASAELAKVDTALIAAADTYQREDEQGMHTYNGLAPK